MNSKQDSAPNSIEDFNDRLSQSMSSIEKIIDEISRAREDDEGTSKRYLISRPTGSSIGMLEDLMLCMAATIEDSLFQAGAVPGDYSILDLYKLAQPFCLELFKKNNISFIDSWPSYEGRDRDDR
jgi:hypothetical protein